MPNETAGSTKVRKPSRSKEPGEIDSLFGILPVELKSKIFEFVPGKTVLRLVCRHWCIIVTGDLLFNAVLEDSTRELLLSGRNYPLKSFKIQNLTKIVSMQQYAALLSSTHFIIGPRNLPENVVSFVKRFSGRAIEFTIESKAFSDVVVGSETLFKYPFSALSTLNIILGSRCSEDSKDIVKHVKSTMIFLIKAKINALRSFSVDFNYANVSFLHPWWRNILTFILNHASTIVELGIVMLGYQRRRFHTNRSYQNTQAIVDQLHVLNLNKLSVEYDNGNGSLGCGQLFLQFIGVKHVEMHRRDDCMCLPGFYSDSMETFKCCSASFDFKGTVAEFPFLHELEIVCGKVIPFSAENIPTLTLTNLERFSLVTEHKGKFFKRLIKYITNRMPKIRELQLISLCSTNNFYLEHLQELLENTKCLRKLTIGQGPMTNHWTWITPVVQFKEFCSRLPQTTCVRVTKDFKSYTGELSTKCVCAVIRTKGSIVSYD